MDETRRDKGAKPPAKQADQADTKPGHGVADAQNGASGDRPTPVAVALKDSGTGDSPSVLATGRGHVAEQILELAFANGIKVREDADLVQILAALDVDSEIPVEALAAASEILAYVYAANRDHAQKDPHPDDTPADQPDNQ